MKLTLNVGHDRKIVIPAGIVEEMRLQPGSPVMVEVTDVKPYVFDQEKWDAAIADLQKLAPAFRQQLLDDGLCECR